MIKKGKDFYGQVEIIDPKGYYAEQFLCRTTPEPNPGQFFCLSGREEILDNIFLAVNLVEEVAPQGLDSVVLDISTEASVMVTQLKMRGFNKVIAIPESSQAQQKLSAECKAEEWDVRMDLGLQSDFLKLEIGNLEESVDVVLFMDSNFGRFKTKEMQKAVIQKVAALLTKNGAIILDLSNPIERIRNISLTPTWSEDARSYCLSRETIDPFTLDYRTEIIRIEKDTCKSTSSCESGVLIPLPNIQELLTGSNLSIKKVFGSYEQDPLQPNSTRMIVIAGRFD